MAGGVIGEAAVRIRPDTAGFAGQVEGQTKGGLLRAGARLAGAFGIAFGVEKIGRQVVKAVLVAADFQQAVADVGSVSNATRGELAALAKQADSFGPSLAIGAKQAAAAELELARAGLSVRQILGGGLKGTLLIASTGQLDLAASAVIATNAMKLFGLSAKELPGVASALAVAANSTAADVSDLAASLTSGGLAAHQAGLSFNQTVAILSALADAGIKGGRAGSALRGAVSALVNPSKKAAAEQTKLGLSFVTANGAIKDGATIAADLQRATVGMTQAERIHAFTLLAGAAGMRTLLALYTSGSDKITKYEAAQRKVGAGAEIVRRSQNTLKGDLAKLGVAWESLQIKAGRAGVPIGRELVQGLTSQVEDLSNNPGLKRGINSVKSALRSAFESKTLRADIKGITGAIHDLFTSKDTRTVVASFASTISSVVTAITQRIAALAPVLTTVSTVIGKIAASPLGPAILIAVAAFRVLTPVAGVATAAVARLTAATTASAAASTQAAAAEARLASATAARGAAETGAAATTALSGRAALIAAASQRTYQSTFVSGAAKQTAAASKVATGIELMAATSTLGAAKQVGAASKVATGLSRIAPIAKTAGAGLLALAGGPVGVAVLAAAGLTAGLVLLAGREGNAAAAARQFSDALRDQASAAREAQAGLEGMRALTGTIVEANAAVTRSFTAQKAAQEEVSRVRAAPAADFGGQAAKTQALKAATNELAVATRGYNEARRVQGTIAAKALTTAAAEAARITEQVAKSRELVAATRIQNSAQVGAALATGLNRTAALRYSEALAQQARGQVAASRNSQASAGILRQQAEATDTTTAAGKRQAAGLRTQAQTASRTATVQRASALSTVTAALSANRQIAQSDKATAAERSKAAGRVKFLDKLAEQIRAQQAASKTAAAQVGKSIAAGLSSAGGQVSAAGAKLGQQIGKGAQKGKPIAQKAGVEGGKAVGQGAISQAGTASAAGSAVGSALGTGVISGINAQIPGIFAAGARAGRAAADGARSTRGGDIKSPSRLMAKEVGAPLAEGIAEGMRSHEKGVREAASALVRAARGAAGAARAEARGISDAFGTQIRTSILRLGARIKPAISQVLRESIASAKSNLQSLAETVTSALSQVIDAQLARQVKAIDSAFDAFASAQNPLRQILDARSAAIDARSQQLDAAAAVDEERRLRNAISLAEAGQSRARQRLASFEASLAKRDPARTAALSPLAREQERQRLEELRRQAVDPAHDARVELERFLLSQDQAQVERERTGLDRARTIAEEKTALDRKAAEEGADAKRVALERGFADLVADLNRGRIKTAAFGEKVKALMRANGVELSGIGAELGRSFVEQFNAQLSGLLGQAGALRAFIDGKPVTVTIERPGLAQAGEAAAVRAALRGAANEAVGRLRTQFQAAGSAGKEKITTGEQAQITALRKILDAIVNQPPGSVIEQLLVQAPGSDPTQIADRIIRQAAAAARR